MAVQTKPLLHAASVPVPEESPKLVEKKRRVIHVSDSDTRDLLRLHQALRKRGDDSRLFVFAQGRADPHLVCYRPMDGLPRRLNRLYRKYQLGRTQCVYRKHRPEGGGAFFDDRSPYGEEMCEQMPEADVVHIHRAAESIDYGKFIPFIAPTPLVWTLHDMNPFTGGCHFDGGCGRYQGGCGFCPQLGSTREGDLSRMVHHRKQRALQWLHPDRVRIVAESDWLASLARNSQLLCRFTVSTIHPGLDTEIFRPRSRSALRDSLNIPPEAFVVLFAAAEARNERNGFRLFREALAAVSGSREIFLLSAGEGKCRMEAPCRQIHLGRFSSDEMFSLFYSAGDCFAAPSFQESFAMDAMEAMACSTPVVGFATAGTADLVKPGETGLLARYGDADDFGGKLQWMMEHPGETKEMGRRARLLVEQNFSVAGEAEQYARLYDELEQHPAPREC